MSRTLLILNCNFFAFLTQALPTAEALVLCAVKDVPVQVEPLVFSGTPNPAFTLQGPELHNVCSLLSKVNGPLNVPTCRVLGFTGWKVCSMHNTSDCAVLLGEPTIDEALLQLLSLHHPKVSTQVLEHIRAEVQRLHSSNGGDTQCAGLDPSPSIAGATCERPVLGPDDPHQVHYDPPNDDQGCFVTKQYDNNCYDYGNDISTNTFAQPGRGSGVCPPDTRPCVKNTCEDVKAAAISDGLAWVGTELPRSLPSVGHYVSLHIWPKTNFHWLRMDADQWWSHKPGGSAVRNVDNKHTKIRDPAKADVSPWSDHCGYMLSVPSKAKVTSNNVDFSFVV